MSELWDKCVSWMENANDLGRGQEEEEEFKPQWLWNNACENISICRLLENNWTK